MGLAEIGNGDWLAEIESWSCYGWLEGGEGRLGL